MMLCAGLLDFLSQSHDRCLRYRPHSRTLIGIVDVALNFQSSHSTIFPWRLHSCCGYYRFSRCSQWLEEKLLLANRSGVSVLETCRRAGLQNVILREARSTPDRPVATATRLPSPVPYPFGASGRRKKERRDSAARRGIRRPTSTPRWCRRLSRIW